MSTPRPGCCTDKSCTPDTCMRLPVIGDTQQLMCADCVHWERCNALFGCSKKSTQCDFFPRRFRMREMELVP